MAMEVLVHLHHVCSGSSYGQRFKVRRFSTESNTVLGLDPAFQCPFESMRSIRGCNLMALRRTFFLTQDHMALEISKRYSLYTFYSISVNLNDRGH